jgi:acyl-coenzyme A thioesterase PaaI-like protein
MSTTSTQNNLDVFNPNLPAVQSRLKEMRTGWKMYLFYLTKLPSMWFWGGRLKYIDFDRCEFTMPYRWASQNPFNSTYFAAQCAAAEFSTGALAQLALVGRGKISMLVSDIQADFTKKATSKVTFVCEEGAKIIAAVDKAIQTKEAQTVTITSVGRMADGTVTCTTTLTWSFKFVGY